MDDGPFRIGTLKPEGASEWCSIKCVCSVSSVFLTLAFALSVLKNTMARTGCQWSIPLDPQGMNSFYASNKLTVVFL